uniref:Gastrin-releasing peptide n=1 Tax=Athene cunicularia TaxID=194338 RepID=A0A663NBQ0_ATHCN
MQLRADCDFISVTVQCGMAKGRPRGPTSLRATVVVVTGHLMGKKSTGDFPYVYEEENKTPFSALPENIKQLEDYLQWEEISKYLLRLLEGNENKSAHFLKGGLPWYTRNTWETDDNSSWKDVSKRKPMTTSAPSSVLMQQNQASVKTGCGCRRPEAGKVQCV